MLVAIKVLNPQTFIRLTMMSEDNNNNNNNKNNKLKAKDCKICQKQNTVVFDYDTGESVCSWCGAVLPDYDD